METKNNKAVYTPYDIMSLLGVSKVQAYKLIRDHIIPSVQLGRRYYVPIEQFNLWLASCVNSEFNQNSQI